MIFGSPTLIETKSIEECASLCKELGLDFIELNMNLPQYQPDVIDIAKFKRISDEYGVFFTIHLDENFNPCDFNRMVADAYMKTILQAIELAEKLSAPVINMHMSNGVYFTMPDRKIYLYEEYKHIYLKKIKEFCVICEQAVGNADIKVCIENTDGFTSFQRDAIELLLQSPVFGLTFDIGHNYCIDGMDEPFIMVHKTKLMHMHLHDAKGKKNHLAPGTGEMDLLKYFYLADRQNCRMVFEIKTIEGLWQSVQWIKSVVWGEKMNYVIAPDTWNESKINPFAPDKQS